MLKSPSNNRRSRRTLLCLGVATMAMAAAPWAGMAAECEDPDALRFSIIPTEETVQELTLYKPVIDYLSIQTGKPVETVEGNSVRLASGEQLQAQAIVIACEAPAAAKLLDEGIPND